MDTQIINILEENNYLKFTIQDINVSLINALRRIILSDIPCIVFKTFPYNENKIDIKINTTRLNNELIKQRLSCIPIHINDTNFPIDNYVVEIDKLNDSDYIQYVTTNDIKIKDTINNTYLSESDTKKIFPPNNLTGDYIDIVRLRPKINNDMNGEYLKLTGKFDVGSAKDNGSYNVVSTASYGNTPDDVLINEKLNLYLETLSEQKMDENIIEFKKKDWLILNSQRYFIKDSFDFIVESIGQFTNYEIMQKACAIMLEKINNFKISIQNDNEVINKSNTTIENCYDITLFNEDYTLGKAIEYILYTYHYINSDDLSDKTLTFCGFRKKHPHNNYSIIRLAFVNEVDKNKIIELFMSVSSKLDIIYNKILNYFE
jgi:DNA-directed RNA polymerase subunit L